MKRITALFIAMLLLAACGADVTEPEELPSLEGWQASAMHETDGVVDETPEIITTTPPATTAPPRTTTPRRTTTTPPKPPTPEPTPSPEPLTEIEEVALLVERFSSAPFNLMPAFDDINEIPIKYFIRLYYWSAWFSHNIKDFFDFEYTEEQMEELNADFEWNWFYMARGVYPHRIEEYVRENYNTNFSIEHYDFSVINDNDKRKPGAWVALSLSALWDEEEQAVIYLYNGNVGGGYGTSSTVLKTYKEDDVYYAVSVDCEFNSFLILVEGYFLHTVQKNENGGFIMVSKKEIDINEMSFTEEELDELKKSWVGEIIGENNRFIISQGELDEIIREVLDSLDSSEELYTMWKILVIDGEYYSFWVRYNTYDENEQQIWETFGTIMVNAFTGEAHFEAYDE